MIVSATHRLPAYRVLPPSSWQRVALPRSAVMRVHPCAGLGSFSPMAAEGHAA